MIDFYFNRDEATGYGDDFVELKVNADNLREEHITTLIGNTAAFEQDVKYGEELKMIELAYSEYFDYAYGVMNALNPIKI